MKNFREHVQIALICALLFIFLFIAGSFGMYALFSWIWGGNDVLTFFTSMNPDSNKISAMSNAGSAIIGYSLAFAGAFTTVILAFLGWRLAYLGHKLAMVERVEYLNDKYEIVLREYSNAVSTLMHSMIIYHILPLKSLGKYKLKQERKLN